MNGTSARGPRGVPHHGAAWPLWIAVALCCAGGAVRTDSARAQPSQQAQRNVGSLLAPPPPPSKSELQLREIRRELAALARHPDADATRLLITAAEHDLQEATAQLQLGDQPAAEAALADAWARWSLASRRVAHRRARRFALASEREARAAEAELATQVAGSAQQDATNLSPATPTGVAAQDAASRHSPLDRAPEGPTSASAHDAASRQSTSSRASAAPTSAAAQDAGSAQPGIMSRATTANASPQASSSEQHGTEDDRELATLTQTSAQSSAAAQRGSTTLARATPTSSPTAIVTAEHGDEPADHDSPHHGTALLDEQPRAPLPGSSPGGVTPTAATAGRERASSAPVATAGAPASAPASRSGVGTFPDPDAPDALATLDAKPPAQATPDALQIAAALPGCAACEGDCSAQPALIPLPTCFARPEVRWATQRAPDLIARARQALAVAERSHAKSARDATRARILLEAALEEAQRIEAERLASASVLRWATAQEARAHLLRDARMLADQQARTRRGQARRQQAKAVFAALDTPPRRGFDRLLLGAGHGQGRQPPATGASTQPALIDLAAPSTSAGGATRPAGSNDAAQDGQFRRSTGQAGSAESESQLAPVASPATRLAVLAERASSLLAAAIALGVEPAHAASVEARIRAAEQPGGERQRTQAMQQALAAAERALGEARRTRGGPVPAEIDSLLEMADERGLSTLANTQGVSAVLEGAFVADSAEFTVHGRAQLQQVAALARAHPHGALRIEAGGAAARARAERIRAALAATIDRARLEVAATDASVTGASVCFTAYGVQQPR